MLKELHDMNHLDIKEIADYHFLKGGFCKDLSLFDGKMGMALFFFLYARYTRNNWYEKFAGELLDDICNTLHTRLPLTFADGLCGIGWGVEFLKKHGFIEGDTDEILREIDHQIMERDLRRISDSSIESGLEGIVAYVRSRMDSLRMTSNGDLFDPIYLSDLEMVSQRMGIQWHAEQYAVDAVWRRILDSFSTHPFTEKESWRAGLVKMDANHASVKEEITGKESCSPSRKCLFIVSENSIASQYGIGTYIGQLVQCFNPAEWDVNVVVLQAPCREVQWKMENEVRYYEIPKQEEMQFSEGALYERQYHKGAFYYLASHFTFPKDVYCHFNFMNHYDLALLFKEKLQARVVFTLHYTDWSFDLLGDTAWLKRILAHPTGLKDERVVDKFEREKKFMMDCCDSVIAIARHSYDMLKDIYGIPENKLAYIPNGLKDDYVKRSTEERQALRTKYGFGANEKLLIFAGRLELVKGVVELIEVFKQVLEEIPTAKLIVAGSGNFIRCFDAATPCWSHIVFTGFIPKEQLYELYAIADLGIVPSIHEEFGYVATEMMLHELPILVNNTTGLKEIVEDGKYGTVFCLKKEKNACRLKESIIKVLNADPKKIRRLNGRNKILEAYAVVGFFEKIVDIYTGVENPCCI